MTKADHAVELGAQRLQELSNRAAARGDGVGEWLAEELANDAVFLRKLKPSLIAARVRGRASTSQAPGAPPPSAPSSRPKKRKRGGKGPAPLIVVAAALATGVLLAKVIDWRGHAHPRD